MSDDKRFDDLDAGVSSVKAAVADLHSDHEAVMAKVEESLSISQQSLSVSQRASEKLAAVATDMEHVKGKVDQLDKTVHGDDADGGLVTKMAVVETKQKAGTAVRVETKRLFGAIMIAVISAGATLGGVALKAWSDEREKPAARAPMQHTPVVTAPRR